MSWAPGNWYYSHPPSYAGPPGALPMPQFYLPTPLLGTFDPFPRSPSHDSLRSCSELLQSPEHQILLKGQLETLLEKITNDIATLVRGEEASSAPSLKLIFSLCAHIGISDNVKFLACEIHDRLIVKGSTEFHTVANYGNPYPLRYDREPDVLSMQDLAVLQIMNCIQLAHKSYTHAPVRETLRVKDLVALIRPFSPLFNEYLIMKSERLILRTLDYNLMFVTTLEVVEIVMLMLGLNQLQYRAIYTNALHALDHVYLQRESIMNMFYSFTVSRNPDITLYRSIFRQCVENNRFIEGCGVLLCALVVLKMEDSRVLVVLEQITKERINLEVGYNLAEIILLHSQPHALEIIAESTKMGEKKKDEGDTNVATENSPDSTSAQSESPEEQSNA